MEPYPDKSPTGRDPDKSGLPAVAGGTTGTRRGLKPCKFALNRAIRNGIKVVCLILKDMSPESVLRAVENNRKAVYRNISAWPGGEIIEWPDMVLMVSDIEHHWFNAVLKTKIDPDNVKARIDAALERLNADRMPVLWSIKPDTQPADLGKHLEARGFKLEMDGPIMAADLRDLKDNPIPPGVTIEEIDDIAAHRARCQLIASVFEVPDFVAEAWYEMGIATGVGPEHPYRQFMARLDGEPVGTASTFLGGGVASIDDVAVIPEAGRRGIGAALCRTAMSLARELGYCVGFVFSTPMGAGMYQKLGFREYFRFYTYVRQPE